LTRVWIVGGAVVLVGTAALWLVPRSGDEPEPPAAERPTAATRDAASGLLADDAARPLTGSPATALPAPAPDGKPPADARSDAASAQDVRPEEALLAAARRAAAASAAGDEAARDAARATLGEERARLIAALRREPADALALLDRLAASDATDALALAVVLRHVPDPQLGRRLASLAEDAPDAHHRRAAILALEGRDAALWFDPVTRAFRADSSSDVRTDAARVLSRSLRDRAFAPRQSDVRTALLAGLDDADPRQRERAAEAFAIDRDAPPAVRERLRVLSTTDPDLRARSMASSALRALDR
jgi:hypothetical protein